MNREHVSSLLADYIDGLLSTEEAASVKKHLAGCAECRDELRFMKRYLKNARAFPRVPVPDDFLEKIHARIDAPARPGIVRTLFFPLRLKLPLEAAAVVAVAVAGVLIFKPFGERGIEYHAEVAEKSVEADSSPAPGAGETEPAREIRKARTRDLALEKRAPADTARVAATNGAAGEKQATVAEHAAMGPTADMSLVLKARDGESTAVAGRTGESRKDMRAATRQKSAFHERSEAAPADYSRTAGSPAAEQAREDMITDLARTLDGRVIRTAGEAAPGSPRLVIVEIPARNYAKFLSGISGAWSIQGQDPSAPPARAARLRLTVSLQD